MLDKLKHYQVANNARNLAIIHIDEMAEASSFHDSNTENSHGWMDLNGWEERKVYAQDIKGNVYEMILNIAKGEDKKILYDISDIKKVEAGIVPSMNSSKERATSSTTHTISQNNIQSNGKKQSKRKPIKYNRNDSSGDGMYSRQIDSYPYDGESAKSRGIRKKAVEQLADNLGRRFGITSKIGKEGMRKEAYRITDKVEKWGWISKADMDNFFDAAVKIEWHKKEATRLLRSIGVQFPSENTIFDFDNMILQTTNNSNGKK